MTFLKEIVPLSAIPLIANTFFYERYVRMPMSHAFSESSYRYGWGERQEHSISVAQTEPMTYPEKGSVAEFITEHYWGYAQGPNAPLNIMSFMNLGDLVVSKITKSKSILNLFMVQRGHFCRTNNLLMSSLPRVPRSPYRSLADLKEHALLVRFHYNR